MSRIIRLLLLGFFLVVQQAGFAQLSDTLFLNPPSSFYPAVRWVWPDDSISKEGINLDLEAISTAGFSEVWLQLEGGKNRRSAVVYNNQRFKEFFQHAKQQAERLGLTIRTDTSSSWNDQPLLSEPAHPETSNVSPFELKSTLDCLRVSLDSLLSSGHNFLFLNALRHRAKAYFSAEDTGCADRYHPQLQKINRLLLRLARERYVFSCVKPTSPIAYLGSFLQLSSEDPEISRDAKLVSEELLEKTIVRDHRLLCPDESSFQVLYIPAGKTLSLKTLQVLRERLTDGLQLVAGIPQPASTLIASDRKEWDKLVKEIWDKLPDGEFRFGAGCLFLNVPAARWKEATHCEPPLVIQSVHPQPFESSCLRTGTQEAWRITGSPECCDTVLIGFPVQNKKPELWNLLSGTIDKTPFYTAMDGRTFVMLQTRPGQPILVLFRTTADSEQGKKLTHNNQLIWSASPDDFDTVTRRMLKSDSLPDVWLQDQQCLLRKSGYYRLASFSEDFPVRKITLKADLPFLRLDRDWTCRSLENPTAPMLQVDSLTGETGFCGELCEWRKTFFLKRQDLENVLWLLQTGRLENGAEVVVNGQAAGLIWADPFEIDITHLLKPGMNTLQVQIQNPSGGISKIGPVTLSAWIKF